MPNQTPCPLRGCKTIPEDITYDTNTPDDYSCERHRCKTIHCLKVRTDLPLDSTLCATHKCKIPVCEDSKHLSEYCQYHRCHGGGCLNPRSVVYGYYHGWAYCSEHECRVDGCMNVMEVKIDRKQEHNKFCSWHVCDTNFCVSRIKGAVDGGYNSTFCWTHSCNVGSCLEESFEQEEGPCLRHTRERGGG